MPPDDLDPDSDPFRPPAVPTEVHCIHCGNEYESYQIEWRVETNADGKKQGFWCCPIEGCDGKGFGFDILPTDPEYRDERGGWVNDEEGEDVDFGEEAVRWQAEDEEAPFHDVHFDAEEELAEILKDVDETTDDPPEEDDDEDQRPF